ncbi:MAG TPA: Flp pilus assembly protein CpaB [Deltaproteobacteria bacterium]|nr:MAG: Flp pilus assembly protein CpaB [Deltaproteobacteria bacterium]RLB08392.1 MAG: Flp pilus assembly protein CpaB [Deltaproteobacteria bacterium]HDM76067.1 Flp pilus assembly protein CpaB [Deltaproteobacteria bacterium]
MRRIRGIIVLLIAIGLGYIAARTVSHYLTRPRIQQVQQVKKAEPKRSKEKKAEIPKGMRIVSINADKVSGLSGKLKKGDRVDVIATTTLPGNTRSAISRIILSDIEVFDTCFSPATQSKGLFKKSNSQCISLILSPSQAAALEAAAQSARISLALRNDKEKDLESTKEISSIYSGTTGTEIINESIRPTPWLIPDGMRAVTIKVRDIDGICGKLQPGDRVDVILSCPLGIFSTQGGNVAPGTEGKVTEFHVVSKMLLQNVVVFATEKSAGTQASPDSPPKKITLLVSPDEALMLAATRDTTEKSKLRLILRKPSDRQIEKTPTVYLTDLLVGRRLSKRVFVYKGLRHEMVTFYK